jgi:UDP-N-acetylglucosamine 2-epimerase (non-hydrolysing)
MPKKTAEKKKIALIVGARPNFVKIAPLFRELKKCSLFESIIIHTGQHYDDDMSSSFFRDLGIPPPDIDLGIGSGSHAEQTGKIMVEFERVCFEKKPDLIIVVGDVNSTAACALVAAKLSILVAHVEAGLRSFDRTMPEEINRLVTDQISDYLFTTCEDAGRNLRAEGIPQQRIFFVGNVMIDTLMEHVESAQESGILDKLSLRRDGQIRDYAVLTLHRPSNVDKKQVLKNILAACNRIAQKIPVVFPAHPRTLGKIKHFRLGRMLTRETRAVLENFRVPEQKTLLSPPLGYRDFLCLMSHAKLVLTDSGGIQEETTILGIPCLTVRDNTERPITVTHGTNRLVGSSTGKIVETAFELLLRKGSIPKTPPLWDGRAAYRIVKVLTNTRL